MPENATTAFKLRDRRAPAAFAPGQISVASDDDRQSNDPGRDRETIPRAGRCAPRMSNPSSTRSTVRSTKVSATSTSGNRSENSVTMGSACAAVRTGSALSRRSSPRGAVRPRRQPPVGSLRDRRARAWRRPETLPSPRSCSTHTSCMADQRDAETQLQFRDRPGDRGGRAAPAAARPPAKLPRSATSPTQQCHPHSAYSHYIAIINFRKSWSDSRGDDHLRMERVAG